tara:strand:+ start:81153 stop:82049 length:897 start_codon:yes stop_codon:yes gene_type:complete
MPKKQIKRSSELVKLRKEHKKIISQERADRKNLEKKNQELIEKTIELTKLKTQIEMQHSELQRSYKEIHELLQMKTDFMNQAAHDLRTPLTPLVTLVPLIKDKVKDKQVQKDLKIVENNIGYLRELVEELVELVKAGREKYNEKFEMTALNGVIEKILGNVDHLLKEKKIKVVRSFNKVPKIHVNKLRVTEVLHNLIANAIKFSNDDGNLEISLKKMDNFIYFRIKDNGIGMSKKAITQIFNPFYKADKSRHTEGTGLGLTICKRIVEGYHGKIWAESKGVGKGSVFHIKIPIIEKRK